MSEITLEVDGITVAHEFPKDDPILEIVRNFYADQVSRDVREALGDSATDEQQIAEVLFWFADRLYRGAQQKYIERAKDEAAREAAERYDVKRPIAGEREDRGEPGGMEPGAPRGQRIDPARPSTSSAGDPAA